MRKLCGTAVALCLFVAVGVRADDATKEKEKLHGTWKAVKVERGGDTKDDIDDHRLTFSGDEFTVKRGDKVIIKGKFKIDPAKKPKEIDMDITEDDSPEGKNKGKTAKGIYVIDGDELKWCTTEPGSDDRPKEFATQAGTKERLITLKREK